MLTEALAGAVEDDFDMRRGFAESLGQFFDGETFLVEKPEGDEFIAFEFLPGDLPERDGVMELPAGFGRMIGVEEFASGFYFPPLGDGLAARDGEEPGGEAAAFFEGVEFSKREEEGFLGEVFGIFAASGEFVEEDVDFFVIPMNNLIRRQEVAPASGEDEIGIGEINH